MTSAYHRVCIAVGCSAPRLRQDDPAQLLARRSATAHELIAQRRAIRTVSDQSRHRRAGDAVAVDRWAASHCHICLCVHAGRPQSEGRYPALPAIQGTVEITPYYRILSLPSWGWGASRHSLPLCLGSPGRGGRRSLRLNSSSGGSPLRRKFLSLC